jgi:hypothetical protein
MRTVLMFASPVVYTRWRTLAAQLGRTYCGIRYLFSRDLIAQRDALYPCWTVAHFLPCTRPPDVMRLHRPQRGRIHHGPSELRAFVSTRSGLKTMPTGHGDDEDDTAPAAVTGAAAGPGRRFTPAAPPRDLQAALAPIDDDQYGPKIFENLGVQDINPEFVRSVGDLLLLRSYFLTNLGPRLGWLIKLSVTEWSQNEKD